MAKIELSKKELEVMIPVLEYKRQYIYRGVLYYKDGLKEGYFRKGTECEKREKLKEYLEKLALFDKALEKLRCALDGEL